MMHGNRKEYYIAVDFDGTLCEDRFPSIGRIRSDIVAQLFNRIEEMKLKGMKVFLILWTCRNGDYLADAKQWCFDNGIMIDYYNESPVNKKLKLSDKVFANEYWDDRAIRV